MFHHTCKTNEITPDANKSTVDKQDKTVANGSDKSTAEMQSNSQQSVVQTIVDEPEPEKKGKFETLKVSPLGKHVLTI